MVQQRMWKDIYCCRNLEIVVGRKDLSRFTSTSVPHPDEARDAGCFPHGKMLYERRRDSQGAQRWSQHAHHWAELWQGCNWGRESPILSVWAETVVEELHGDAPACIIAHLVRVASRAVHVKDWSPHQLAPAFHRSLQIPAL
uniref:Uncharacterized protein n=1 Tax=Physcomitrium patens TaxID=3218 RepID=A0A2K1IUM3_PHYPA|nr:hypothetical protein PHYPA_024913 [Physcomitrium patens]